MPQQGCVIRNTYRRWIDHGLRVMGYIDTSAWYEVGTVSQYLETNLAFASGHAHWPGIQGDASHNLVGTNPMLNRARLHQTVVGNNVYVAEGVRLRRVVLWDDVRVETDLENAIVTTKQVIHVAPTS
jgi:NDP-sugar pyrophosphorylase family protein